jgi:hypothetical protein
MTTFNENLDVLLVQMRACEQTQGMSVLDHGVLVHDRYFELLRHLRDGSPLEGEWRLPEWLLEHRQLVLDRLFSDDIVAAYAIHHDCGKPSVLTIDADGRRHFPGHAAASERVWREIGGDPEVATLIGMDMDAHVIKDADVAEFAARPQACTLLLVALSEIHANAGMFGGIESTSFKMKWKQLDRRGKAVMKLLVCA